MNKSFFKRNIKSTGLIFVFLLVATMLYVNLASEPKKLHLPVLSYTPVNWDRQSFWFSPWGRSGVHKGIDIFAPHRTPVVSPVDGIVIEVGNSQEGGNYIYILGPRLLVYYYAHLNRIRVKRFENIKALSTIGEVGNTGNASLKPYHLHFSVSSMLPIFRRYNSNAVEGWKQMFFLNPNDMLL